MYFPYSPTNFYSAMSNCNPMSACYPATYAMQAAFNPYYNPAFAASAWQHAHAFQAACNPYYNSACAWYPSHAMQAAFNPYYSSMFASAHPASYLGQTSAMNPYMNPAFASQAGMQRFANSGW